MQRKVTPRLRVGILKKMNRETTLQAFSYKSRMPVWANMSQQGGLCDDCLTPLELLQTLGTGFHKAEQGGKKEKDAKDSHKGESAGWKRTHLYRRQTNWGRGDTVH